MGELPAEDVALDGGGGRAGAFLGEIGVEGGDLGAYALGFLPGSGEGGVVGVTCKLGIILRGRQGGIEAGDLVLETVEVLRVRVGWWCRAGGGGGGGRGGDSSVDAFLNVLGVHDAG